MVLRILRGERPGDIKPERGAQLRLFVNTKAAERQGVQLPSDMLQSAQMVVR